jgi:hypothetical protein
MAQGNFVADTPLLAHVVGSVPLGNSEAVFRTVAGTLGPYLR